MSIQTYGQAAGRLGRMAGEIIGHAMHCEVLTTACQQLDMPKNKSDTLVVRSWVPYGATVSAPNTFSVSADAHITQEGITPNADTIVPRDVTFTLQQYMCLYSLTDKDYDLHEDDISAAMKEQTGERMGLVREMAIYGKMKACTNKFYAGTGVTTRAGVNAAITGTLIANVLRSLKSNHAKPITKVLAPSQGYGTTSVEAGYVAYCHTDCEDDIRNLAGFKDVSDYGVRSTISDYELGTWRNVRFIVSPELSSYGHAGAAVGSTDLKSDNATNIDVYPVIFMAKEAFAQVKIRGIDDIQVIDVPVGKQDKSDPGGQRGYIGAKFWHTSEIMNQGWMAVAEVGVTDLA